MRNTPFLREMRSLANPVLRFGLPLIVLIEREIESERRPCKMIKMTTVASVRRLAIELRASPEVRGVPNRFSKIDF